MTEAAPLPADGTAGPALPGDRDRFIDAVRVASMVAVVVLHWISIMPSWDGGRLVDRNVVDVRPALWPFTWPGDVMSLFFFVGGYANWICYHRARARGDGDLAFLAARFRRLIPPTLGFLGLWLTLDVLVRISLGAGRAPLSHVGIGSTTPFGPLWFLGVYLLVILVSPLTIRAHRRFGRAVPVVLGLAVAVVDQIAFGLDRGGPLVLNLLLVWLVPHQLGYLYADGRLRRPGTRACLLAAGAGLIALAALTSTSQYPRSLVHARWTVLTIDAPTLSLVVAAIWLIGLALAMRRWLLRRLAHPRVWDAVRRANRLTMPIYLWHMTAYLLAALCLGRFGFVWGTDPTLLWWLGRPVMVVASAVALAGLLLAGRALGSAATQVRAGRLVQRRAAS